MAKDNETQKRQLLKMNSLFKSTSDQISTLMYGSNNQASNELEYLNSEVDNIINSELNDTKNITSSEMSVFLVKLFNDFDRKNGDIKTLDDIFASDSSGLFQFFQERYQNQNLMFEDLKIISDQLFELSEAILTTRDAIVTSDDIAKTVSRTIRFSHIDGADSDDIASYIRAVEDMEKRLKLLSKLKNQVIPNTLTYGRYYAYICPYKQLFQEQFDKKQKDIKYTENISESIDDEFVNVVRESINTCTASNDISKKVNINDKPQSLAKTIKSCMENISVSNDVISIPLIEGVDISELVDNDQFIKTKKKATQQTQSMYADGTVDINESGKKSNKNLFENETGCYIKYIDPRKIIPVTILDTVIGYYYVHTSDLQVNKSPFSSTIRVTMTNGVPYRDTENIEMTFLSQVTDKIVKAFNKPFLEKNNKFKDLILNSLLYNDMYKRQINYQFIPADYIVEFKVNEDEDGNGQSVLLKSLFYAKLYLALLIFKMISIITKSNDTRVYYIKNSGIDQNVTNKVQEVARSIKGRQINFMDLLNYNSIISKIGSYKEIFIPVGRSGERGIDFDILAGQDVPLNTDLMEMLRTNMINGTGVPSVIMNYINEADYAKTLTMANSKFVGRVVNFQLDLNDSTTEFYKKIIKFSNIAIPENALLDFEFVYNPPKTLNNMNMADMISNADVVINAAIKAITGENAEQTDDNNRIKDKIYNELFRKFMPMLDWNDIDNSYKNAKIEIAEEKMKTKANEADNNDSQNNY